MLAAAATAHHRDAGASSDRRDSGRGARGGARLGRHRCWGRDDGKADVTWFVDEGGLVSVIFIVVLLVLVAYPAGCRCFGVPGVEIVCGDLQGCELQPTRARPHYCFSWQRRRRQMRRRCVLLAIGHGSGRTRSCSEDIAARLADARRNVREEIYTYQISNTYVNMKIDR